MGVEQREKAAFVGVAVIQRGEPVDAFAPSGESADEEPPVVAPDGKERRKGGPAVAGGVEGGEEEAGVGVAVIQRGGPVGAVTPSGEAAGEETPVVSPGGEEGREGGPVAPRGVGEREEGGGVSVVQGEQPGFVLVPAAEAEENAALVGPPAGKQERNGVVGALLRVGEREKGVARFVTVIQRGDPVPVAVGVAEVAGEEESVAVVGCAVGIAEAGP